MKVSATLPRFKKKKKDSTQLRRQNSSSHGSRKPPSMIHFGVLEMLGVWCVCGVCLGFVSISFFLPGRGRSGAAAATAAEAPGGVWQLQATERWAESSGLIAWRHWRHRLPSQDEEEWGVLVLVLLGDPKKGWGSCWFHFKTTKSVPSKEDTPKWCHPVSKHKLWILVGQFDKLT